MTVAPVGDAHPARPVGASRPGSDAGNNAATSRVTPLANVTTATVVTRNECGEKWPGNPAPLSRRFIIRALSGLTDEDN